MLKVSSRMEVNIRGVVTCHYLVRVNSRRNYRLLYLRAGNKAKLSQGNFGGGPEIFQIPDKFYGPPQRALRPAMKDQASRC